MEIRYNVTGARRKELVKVISDTTGAKAEYKFMPTCNYEIDYFTVTKDGTILFDDRADSEEIEQVLEAIAAAGFECEPQDGGDSQVGEVSETEDNAAQAATEGCGCPVDTSCEARSTDRAGRRDLTVAVPRDSLSDAAIENLQRIVDSKAALIKKALGSDSLPIEVTDEKVSFPWFTQMDGDSAQAYMHLVSALCEMARCAKRVTATEKEVDNEKYAFRCFLLRLGFIGAEYKTERKILLKNLTGSSAFKNGGADYEVSE
ncbi:MAG: virulence protein [Lachnospiraceae bacterium]|nr:virulence protein [Lachnospiraceae bacterium]